MKKEITKVLKEEQVKATRVLDMGTEKDGKQHVLYHAKSSLGVHWFVVPEKQAEKLQYEESAVDLIKWLEIKTEG